MNDEMKTTNVTRTTIEKVIDPAVTEAMAAAQIHLGFDEVRRLARALVHLGARRLLEAGADPQLVVAQVGEALMKELASHKTNQQAATGAPPAPLALA